MRKFIFTLTLALISPVTAHSEAIPIQDGEYAQKACSSGLPDIDKSYSIYTVQDGKHKGSRYLSPLVEGQEGACITEKIIVKGNIYSGSAKCEDGGSRIRYSTGTYRFSLKILNSRSFISKGYEYVWCAAHR